jgi:hypothetical protein
VFSDLGRGRDRLSLYYDAYDPNTRCETYTLLPSTPVASFDVGHRRLSVQRIHYASVVAPGAGPADRLTLTLPELHIEVIANGPVLRLCVSARIPEARCYSEPSRMTSLSTSSSSSPQTPAPPT